MSAMVVRGALLIACVAVAAVASADPKPRAVDIKPLRDRLVVLKDADGGVYAVTNERGGKPRVFYGTAKVLHEAVLEGSSSRDGDAWSVSVMAPRTAYPFMAFIERKKDGSYRRACGNDGPAAELAVVTGDQATAILDRAKFLTTQVIRRPHLLARDDRGVYYYVDVLRDQYGGRGHRVFVGTKGALKKLPLTDVASDTSGEVFSTKSGDLRLTWTREGGATKPTAQWIRGERKNELVFLDVYMNQPLIFRDLGIYKLAGTLCGNL